MRGLGFSGLLAVVVMSCGGCGHHAAERDAPVITLRPVLEDLSASSCVATTGADEAVLIGVQFGAGTGCFRVGPGVLTLGRGDVSSAAAVDQPGQGWVFECKLNARASARFDAVANRYFGKQLAMVVGGRVLSAPTINARNFNGAIQISGMTKTDAQRLASQIH